MLKSLKKIYLATPGIPPIWRAVRKGLQDDPVCRAFYQKVFESGKLRLPWVDPEAISPAAGGVFLPALYPLYAGEDAPLADILFLMNAAKGRGAKRILEVGTYRARTTYAFFLNCPDSRITSYDIQRIDSGYRTKLEKEDRVSLRLRSFQESEDELKKEEPYDFIFIDGSHRVNDVVLDSLLAFKILAVGGLIVWHDYRTNGYATELLCVPEGLSRLPQGYLLHGVRGTTCAVFEKKRP